MIDENVIYREAFKTITTEEWFFDSVTTGKEVGSYIIGVSNLASRLLKNLDRKSESKEEVESNWGQ